MTTSHTHYMQTKVPAGQIKAANNSLEAGVGGVAVGPSGNDSLAGVPYDQPRPRRTPGRSSPGCVQFLAHEDGLPGCPETEESNTSSPRIRTQAELSHTTERRAHRRSEQSEPAQQAHSINRAPYNKRRRDIEEAPVQGNSMPQPKRARLHEQTPAAQVCSPVPRTHAPLRQEPNRSQILAGPSHAPGGALAEPPRTTPRTRKRPANDLDATDDPHPGSQSAQSRKRQRCGTGEINAETTAPSVSPGTQIPTRPRLTADDVDDGDMEQHVPQPADNAAPQMQPPAQRGEPRPVAARRVAGMRVPGRGPAKEWRERAHIRVGTLNMNGRGAQQIGYAGSKWPEINAIMRDRRISILAVQETHLKPEHLADLEKLYARLLVINSAHENATTTAGVALVFNRDHIADTDRIRTWDIVPGRALAAQLDWKSQRVTILAIYGPNDKDESISLWESIAKWKNENAASVNKVDVLLEDLNFVEDEMDRAPVRFAAVDGARAKFRKLKEDLGLSDGWRKWNEGRLEWTWRRPGTFERSRIDRIYLNDAWLEDSRDWTTDQAFTSSDHYLVTVDLTNKLCPQVGRGRWAMPNAILDDKKFVAQLEPLVRQLAADTDRARRDRTAEQNIQTIFEKFKADAAALARERGKAMGSAAKKSIGELNKKRLSTQNDKQLDDETRATRVRDLEASIAEQQLKQCRSKSDQVKTTDWVMGDDQNKYFFTQGKQHKPRDTVKSLRKAGDGPTRWATDSGEMATVAKSFYENLQTVDMDKDPNERAEAIDEALNHVNRHLSGEQRAELGSDMSRDLIALALKEAKKDSAPGTDGLPYEFWQMLDHKFQSSKNSEDPWPDIVQILTWLYNDIEKNGVDPKTSFTKGWLCPLFKKGNRDDIANYRPITLLNTDYKLYTKALSIRLASVAPDLIHKDQAGFMKGRSITDQCKLAKLMVNWGEARSVNGAIVCLDQEKAYDRIAHDYLFVVLGAFNLPDSFIKTVKSLYEHAETEVILNGFRSSTFRVIRGVRQGDPLSCLLFNLAIEPLAEMIRCSQLSGFTLPGSAYRLVISLFADDTCVYLSQGDDPAVLQAILDRWCLASGAKFNLRKTEIVPVGTEEFRGELTLSRRMRPDTAPFPPGAKIAAEGEAVRLLGAFIGNGIDQNGPWEPIIESIKKTLQSWNIRTLSLTGKALVARSIVTGKTQYLGMVQGMPMSVQTEVTDLVMDFIWPEGRRKAYINAEQLRARTEEGGKLLPDFYLAEKSREIVWLHKMLLPPNERPIWTDLAEDLMRIRIVPDGGQIQELVRVSPFLQQWRPNFNGLPSDLRRMIEVAKEIGLQINAPSIPQRVQRAMPFWLHIGRRAAGAVPGNRTSQRDEASLCLQNSHRILSTGQAADALQHSRGRHIFN